MGDAAAKSALGGGVDNGGWRCRCVLLVPPGLPRPERLWRGLIERTALVTVVRDAPSVLVELAAGARVLIIHEPGTVRRCAELLDAVRRFHPLVRCWRSQNINGHGRVSLARFLDPGAVVPPAKSSAASNETRDEAQARVDGVTDRPASRGSVTTNSGESGALFGGATTSRAEHVAPRDDLHQAREVATNDDGPRELAASIEAHPQPTPRRDEGAPLVTAEELAMLLGGDDAGAYDDDETPGATATDDLDDELDRRDNDRA